MDTTRIDHVDAVLQRLQQVRAGHTSPATDTLSKQTLAELDRAIEELKVVAEEISSHDDELGRVMAAAELERGRRTELMEALAVPCFFTDENGAVQEANTSALLLMGASLQKGGASMRALLEPNAFDAIMARCGREVTVTEAIAVQPEGRPAVRVRASVARVRNVEPPLWRWFLQRERA